MNEGKFKAGAFLVFVLFAALMLFFNTPAKAQAVTVYAVFDVDAEVTTCRTVLNGAAPVDVTAVVDNVRGVAAKNFRVCLVNVSGVPDGANVVSAAPYDATWGVTGVGVQLPFNRPPAGGSSGVGAGRLSR
jgi:hypothetical protein